VYKFVNIYTRIWSDRKFRSLSAEGMIVFFYLILNDNLTLTGIYELDSDVARIKTNLGERFSTALEEVIKVGLVEYDDDAGVIWLTNRFKLMVSKSPKVLAGVVDELNQIQHPFKLKFVKKYKDELEPHLYRMKEYKNQSSDGFLDDESMKNIVKLYNGKEGAKRFLMKRGLTPEKIDVVLARILV